MKNCNDGVKVMQKFVEDLYCNNKSNFEMFGFDPNSCDDIERKFYIYAWFIKGNNKRYFYVGKGTGSRYRHILNDIKILEKNPRKYKGKPYKLLQDEFGIESEFLYNDLTEKEATILEAYSMIKLYKNKEPLLNVIIPCEIMNDKSIMDYRD